MQQQSFLNRDSFLNQAFLNRECTVLPIFSILRECIGWKHLVMVDANQKWSVPEAIEWMKELAQFKLHWIEEPTSPDDILGHLGQVLLLKLADSSDQDESVSQD